MKVKSSFFLSCFRTLMILSVTQLNAQFPGNYSTGIRFWLKANAGTFSNAGTTASTNNSLLQQWNDQSGNTNNAIQTTAALKPVYLTAISNNNPAIRFDGDNYLDANATSGITGTSDYSAFFVVKLTTPSAGTASDGSGTYILDRTTATNELFSLKVITQGGTNRFMYQKRNNGGSNLGGPVSNSVVDASNFQIIQMSRIYNSAGNTISRLYINGILEASTSNASETTIPPQMRIGRHATATGGGINGDLTEMIVYNNEPPAANQQRIYSYLAIKYGISLNQSTLTDYVSSGGTVIYPATTTHINYTTTITGIGQDNNSVLNQTNSKNQSTNDFVRMQNPSALGNNDFLLWGSNNGSMIVPNTTDVGGAVSRRLSRVWRVAVTNTPGSVDITINLASVPGTKSQADLRLLIDRDGDGFADNDVTPLSGTLVGNDFTISGVTLQNGDYFTVGSVNGATTPLPVEMSSFEAKCRDNFASLRWSTLTEHNTLKYEIERTKDGLDFKTIGSVSAAGNSFIQKNYEYTDVEASNELNYYRLKQIDVNGDYELYGPLASDCSNKKGFSIYPNPTQGKISVENFSFASQAIVKDVFGKIVYRFLMQSGISEIDLPISPGIYFVNFESSSSISNTKIIVK